MYRWHSIFHSLKFKVWTAIIYYLFYLLLIIYLLLMKMQLLVCNVQSLPIISEPTQTHGSMLLKVVRGRYCLLYGSRIFPSEFSFHMRYCIQNLSAFLTFLCQVIKLDLVVYWAMWYSSVLIPTLKRRMTCTYSSWKWLLVLWLLWWFILQIC